jgi:hypothetical protein
VLVVSAPAPGDGAGIDEQKDTECHYEEAGANADLPLPFDEGCQQPERKHHRQHREQVTDGKRAKRGNESARAFFHQSG